MSYRHILLIDDDEDDQEVFMTALDSLPVSIPCTVASNGHDALQKLTTGQVAPDLILLDLNMPVMNGTQFLQEIKGRQELRDIPVIVFSTASNQETIRESKKLGACDFITKPDKFSQLIKLLRDLLH